MAKYLKMDQGKGTETILQLEKKPCKYCNSKGRFTNYMGPKNMHPKDLMCGQCNGWGYIYREKNEKQEQ